MGVVHTSRPFAAPSSLAILPQGAAGRHLGTLLKVTRLKFPTGQIKTMRRRTPQKFLLQIKAWNFTHQRASGYKGGLKQHAIFM